jgi:ketosteroid isomerase-like protein
MGDIEDQIAAVRVTWSLARRESAWKIVHEHTSAPIGFKDLKAILQRQIVRS